MFQSAVRIGGGLNYEGDLYPVKAVLFQSAVRIGGGLNPSCILMHSDAVCTLHFERQP